MVYFHVVYAITCFREVLFIICFYNIGNYLNIFAFIFICFLSIDFFFSLKLFCMLAEYMPGGSLYDYLHKNHNVLKLPQLLKFAIDVCKGMGYLHQNNIIHRDLKTANLLMDTHNVSNHEDQLYESIASCKLQYILSCTT